MVDRSGDQIRRYPADAQPHRRRRRGIDDAHILPEPTLAIYEPIARVGLYGGRLFVRASANPYMLVSPITRSIRAMSADQAIEHAATLEDVKAEVLTPDRLNSLVFGGFAIVALAIAVVGVAGVLAFSVSARTREFGIRLAIGSQSSRLLAGVMREAAVMATAGIVAGVACGYVLARLWVAGCSTSKRRVRFRLSPRGSSSSRRRSLPPPSRQCASTHQCAAGLAGGVSVDGPFWARPGRHRQLPGSGVGARWSEQVLFAIRLCDRRYGRWHSTIRQGWTQRSPHGGFSRRSESGLG